MHHPASTGSRSGRTSLSIPLALPIMARNYSVFRHVRTHLIPVGYSCGKAHGDSISVSRASSRIDFHASSAETVERSSHCSGCSMTLKAEEWNCVDEFRGSYNPVSKAHVLRLHGSQHGLSSSKIDRKYLLLKLMTVCGSRKRAQPPEARRKMHVVTD